MSCDVCCTTTRVVGRVACDAKLHTRERQANSERWRFVGSFDSRRLGDAPSAVAIYCSRER